MMKPGDVVYIPIDTGKRVQRYVGIVLEEDGANKSYKGIFAFNGKLSMRLRFFSAHFPIEVVGNIQDLGMDVDELLKKVHEGVT